jgi:ATP-dependent Clp protease protease subunit
MATPQVPAINLPEEVYAVFCGGIDQASIQKIFLAVATASQNNVRHIHLMFRSTGGTVGDGIALYNYLRAAPVDMTLYNVGSVQSIAAVAYLGAKKRKTSARASFVFHRTTASPQSADAGLLKTITESIVMDDRCTESILREHLKIPDEKWAVLDQGNLWFAGEDAIKANIADEVAEFAPPVGSRIFSV